MKMSKSEFIKWLTKADAEEIKRKEPIEITYDGEVVRKFVPTNWRNPMFPIH